MHKKLTHFLLYSFARRIKNPRSLQPSPQSNITDQQQLKQQFQPLSSSPQVQRKIRENVLKSLSYEGQDPSPHKLVNRPSKGVVWGLGGQLIMAQKKRELEGLKLQIDQIIKFLELHQVKNIYIHDWSKEEDKTIDKKRFSVVGSCFSAKHCHKVGIQLKNAFNKSKWRERKDPILAQAHGGKDDEWMLVFYKGYEISLMTEEQRQASDLQWKWNNPVPEETVDKYSQLQRHRKSRKKHFEDLE